MKKYVSIIIALFLFFCVHTSGAQETKDATKDTLTIASNRNELKSNALNNNIAFKPNPRNAVLFSIIAPGLGQIYNRKYWKLPIIYGAFVGLAYGISWNGKYYSDYKQAYIDILDDNPNTISYENMLPLNESMSTIDKTWFTSVLKQKKETYRRYRDLNIIGVVGVYALTIVDAFVDAQLFDFDISEDLTLNIEPQIQPIRNNTAFGLQCRLSF